jgi:hypothetical protein
LTGANRGRFYALHRFQCRRARPNQAFVTSSQLHTDKNLRISFYRDDYPSSLTSRCHADQYFGTMQQRRCQPCGGSAMSTLDARSESHYTLLVSALISIRSLCVASAGSHIAIYVTPSMISQSADCQTATSPGSWRFAADESEYHISPQSQ